MSTEPSPREVDIAFSTPMILAEREGRKSVTRRIIKPQPVWLPEVTRTDCTGELHWPIGAAGQQCGAPWRVRWQAGDILRVREAAWMWCAKVRDLRNLTPKERPKYRYHTYEFIPPIYVADHPAKPTPREAEVDDEAYRAPHFGWRLKIPRFLPGWAVRRRLRVTSVRVERLQAITEEDAKREGVNVGERGHIVGSTPDQIGRLPCTHCGKKRIAHVGSTHACWGGMGTTWNPTTYRGGFSYLWESINGPGSWDANPWVARIEFERL